MINDIELSDKEEKIVAWNPFAEKMLGMTREDLFNKPVKDLYPKEETSFILRNTNVCEYFLPFAQVKVHHFHVIISALSYRGIKQRD